MKNKGIHKVEVFQILWKKGQDTGFAFINLEKGRRVFTKQNGNYFQKIGQFKNLNRIYSRIFRECGDDRIVTIQEKFKEDLLRFKWDFEKYPNPTCYLISKEPLSKLNKSKQ